MSIQGWEWVIILIIVILVFGIGRIGRIGRELGEGVRAFREGLREGQNNADSGDKKE